MNSKIPILLCSIMPGDVNFIPLSIRSIGSYLSHSETGKDCDVYYRTFRLHSNIETQISADIEDLNFIAIGLSVYIWNYDESLELCKYIKRVYPNIRIVLGGPMISVYGEEILRQTNIDLAIIGEGEEAFRLLVQQISQNTFNPENIPNAIYTNCNQIVKSITNVSFNIKDCNYPLIVFDNEQEYFIYETLRGCPFKCRFCAWDISGRNKVRYYPDSKTQNDLSSIFANEKINHLQFVDSNLFISKNHGKKILEIIIQKNKERVASNLKEIFVSFEINPEFIDTEIIELFSKLPSFPGSITCGLQTTNEQLNNEILNRKFHKEVYLSNLKKLLEKLSNNVSIELIYGLPGDTFQGFVESLETMYEIGIYFPACFHFLVLPGTYFWDHTEEFGIRTNPSPPHQLLESNTWSQEDLKNCKLISLTIYLLYFVFRPIRKYLINKCTSNRMRIVLKMMDYLCSNQSDFFNIFVREIDNNGIFSTFLLMNEYAGNNENLPIRNQIMKDLRQFIDSEILVNK